MPLIDDSSISFPFLTTATFVHILEFVKQDTKGVRVQFTDNSEASDVTYFNPVESLSAETFVGETFEAQRGIRYTNTSGTSQILIDSLGIRGKKNTGQNDTFSLLLDGSFCVGYSGWSGTPDSYMTFDPDWNSGQGRLLVRGRGEFEEGYIGT